MTPVFTASIGMLLYIATAPVPFVSVGVFAVDAFNPTSKYQRPPTVHQRFHRELRIGGSAAMATNRNDDSYNLYDLSKPIFDLYSFRMVRGDALTQYNLRNQSEPLRINLAIIGALFLLSLPSIISEMSGASGGATTIPTTVPYVTPQLKVSMLQAVASWIGAAACSTFGVQQAIKRNNQLLRIEKECAACDLQIQLPMTWIGSDRPYQLQSESIGSVIKNKNCRIVALSGSTDALLDILQNELRVYNRRWAQSNTYWVLVPTNTAGRGSVSSIQARYPWLAQASDIDAWNFYFQNLKGETGGSATSPAASGESVAWFGLSATGRSFGSGSSRPTSYLQLLGNSLSPIDVLTEDEPKSKGMDQERHTEGALLSCQERFYNALTEGKLDIMQRDVFMLKSDDDAKEVDASVTAVLQQGGRLDAWETCLMPDAKPSGMIISDQEVTVLGDGTTAYTTCIEFPVDTYRGGGSTLPTLLAVQKWKRVQPSSPSEWKLVVHQTIPWTSDRPAGGTLLCDSRGCVALVRSSK
jgi:hypothetical protein